MPVCSLHISVSVLKIEVNLMIHFEYNIYYSKLAIKHFIALLNRFLSLLELLSYVILKGLY